MIRECTWYMYPTHIYIHKIEGSHERACVDKRWCALASSAKSATPRRRWYEWPIFREWRWRSTSLYLYIATTPPPIFAYEWEWNGWTTSTATTTATTTTKADAQRQRHAATATAGLSTTTTTMTTAAITNNDGDWVYTQICVILCHTRPAVLSIAYLRCGPKPTLRKHQIKLMVFANVIDGDDDRASSVCFDGEFTAPRWNLNHTSHAGSLSMPLRGFCGDLLHFA